ncbi:MAG: transporter ATP-binding protein [Hyphomicrobiales bacterium]|nr:transporter ATP-binding protein [Hyphomicrobiales bacterium]
MPKAKFSRVLRFVVHYWLLSPGLFFTLVAARIVSTLVDVLVPLASGRLVDAVASGKPGDAGPAIRALVIFIALGALFQASRQIVTFLLNRLSARAITTIGRDAFAKVQRFSSDWHANSFAGATVRKITRGMSSFDTFTDTLAFGLLPAFIVVVGVTAVFAWRWPILGLVVAVGILLFLAVTVALAVLWIRPANVEAREWDSKMSGVLADSITGNAVVKSFAAEAREDQQFAEIARGWEWRAVRSWDRSAVSGLAQAGLLILLQIGMLGTGLWLWTQGRATPGDIASLIATQFLITGYLRDIAQHVRGVQRTINDMDDVLDFRTAELQVADATDASELRVPRGEIAFEHVTFKYKGAREPLYADFSLTIPAGQRVGLVGQSGAGKSTFVKLIQRLYDLDGGRICIDGQDIAHVSQSSLRSSVGLVPQDPVLFHRSIAENISYGRPGATMDEIVEAARLAHVEEFVSALPKGYETLVGERGVKLSGGERQRVAIARAILAATPILILDEATSSLDSVSEHYIREAMDRVAAGRTTIVIAHRLSTVQRLDRILVFDHGRIVEDGTHRELMLRAGGVYRRLVETQAGSVFIEEAAE